jgi:hypothetical protein
MKYLNYFQNGLKISVYMLTLILNLYQFKPFFKFNNY